MYHGCKDLNAAGALSIEPLTLSRRTRLSTYLMRSVCLGCTEEGVNKYKNGIDTASIALMSMVRTPLPGSLLISRGEKKKKKLTVSVLLERFQVCRVCFPAVCAAGDLGCQLPDQIFSVGPGGRR